MSSIRMSCRFRSHPLIRYKFGLSAYAVPVSLAKNAGTQLMRYLILALFFLMAGIAYVQRAAISVPASQVASDLQITHFEESMGFVQSAWYLGYALLQIPAGRLADRWGCRRSIVLYCLLWSLATATTGFVSGLWSLSGSWFLMGALQAGAFPCAAGHRADLSSFRKGASLRNPRSRYDSRSGSSSSDRCQTAGCAAASGHFHRLFRMATVTVSAGCPGNPVVLSVCGDCS